MLDDIVGKDNGFKDGNYFNKYFLIYDNVVTSFGFDSR